METEMAECPKCPGTLRLQGNYWVCSNDFCNYRRERSKTVLSQAELLIKVRELEELVAKLTRELAQKAYHDAQDTK